jgi:hypothetical protein
MKRTLLLSTLLILIGFGSFSKSFAQEGAKVGFRLSPLIGWANVSDDSTKTKPAGLETTAGLGFSFDFVFTYGFSDAIGLRTGINIATKKVGTNFDLGALGSVDSKTSFTAVEVPIGLKFRSPEIGSGMHIIGHFGLNPEFNVQNKVVTTSTLGSAVVTTEQRDVDGIRLFTASFVPGVGLDWEFDWGMLEFAATYHWGLLSYTDPDKTGGAVSKLNYIALNLGYFF